MSKTERRIFVSDHDGTLTDADQEALHYDEIALAYLVKALGVREEELAVMLTEAKAEIKRKPIEYGWKMGGFIVAPATADHYVFNQTALAMVIDRLRTGTLVKSSRVPTVDEQPEFANQFFYNTSAVLAKSGSFYRAGAEAYIRELSEAGDFVIVTNSKPDSVATKLRGLLGDAASELKLVGNARKYVVDTDWVGVVPTGLTDLPGFPRGVYLQRKTYYETLAKLAEGDMSRIAVCGDIPELDTLMVDFLGCRTAMIQGGTSTPWELNYYMNGDPKRFVSSQLELISAWLAKK